MSIMSTSDGNQRTMVGMILLLLSCAVCPLVCVKLTDTATTTEPTVTDARKNIPTDFDNSSPISGNYNSASINGKIADGELKPEQRISDHVVNAPIPDTGYDLTTSSRILQRNNEDVRRNHEQSKIMTSHANSQSGDISTAGNKRNDTIGDLSEEHRSRDEHPPPPPSRYSRHLEDKAHSPIVVPELAKKSGYDPYSASESAADDIVLPVNNTMLPDLLDLARCRAICPKQCWQSCVDIFNNRTVCTKLPSPGNKSERGPSISLPCTVFERQRPHSVTACPYNKRRHLVKVSVTYYPRISPPTTTADEDNSEPSSITIMWDMTTAPRNMDDDAPVVIVFWRDKYEASWLYVDMYNTKDMYVPFKESADKFDDLSFLLVAVSPSCILDTQLIKLPNTVLHSPIRSTYKVPDDITGQLMADDASRHLSRAQHAPFTFPLTAETTILEDNRLYVRVTWVIPDWLITEKTVDVKQTVTWARQQCEPVTGLTICGEDTALHNRIKLGAKRGPAVNEFILTDHSNMTYNSLYWVVVKLNNIYRSERYNFTTPSCEYPTAAFTRCLPKPACAQNNSCGTKSAPDFMSWEINFTCWQRDREPARREVKVHLAWSEPATERAIIEYTVWYKSLTDSSRITLKTRTLQIPLQLDSVYGITILARLAGSNEPSTVRAPSIYVNTTLDALHELWPQCETLVVTQGSSPLAISLAVLGGFIMAALTILVMYKKRHSCREIIIDKATVAKSNSYKSTLGAYSDLRDHKRLLPDNETWEIDPQQVALGAELGHGAFGRVLTGHYKDEKVAIKILKEGAPFFQREDLLREIHIMRTLGTHPNIISFVGACTLREPIALIMEYMPHGNLQQFLRHFRRDGELDRGSDGYKLIYAPLDQVETSDKWVLGPTDFLSYARQMAMAMEYMSEHQYVHRDLAARNVLVGQNKTVKLCDFGLARLVYSDDQYYRLTGGRLPIRWMALESLRDRMYTSQSDVWAFGILLWEIVTLGCSPYPNVSLGELFTKLCDGYRMEQPRNCSDELYDLMSQCWCENPNDRPTFTHLRLQLEMLLTQNMNYLALDNLDFSYDSSEGSEGAAPFDVSMESLVTDHEFSSNISLSNVPLSANSQEGALNDEQHACLLHHSVDGAVIPHRHTETPKTPFIKHKNWSVNKSKCRSETQQGTWNKTFSTWSLDGDDLKHWLKMHALTKSTLSLADLQNSYSQFSQQRTPNYFGSTSSEIHTISTIL